MITVTLPDGQLRHLSQPASAQAVAGEIHPRLQQRMLAARLDGDIVDARTLIQQPCKLEVITAQDAAALELLRHSCAHLLAQAVKRLFPTAQVAIGPVIEQGFYYDFALPRPLTPDDLALIEDDMRQLAQANLPITRRELSRAAAIAHFRAQNEHYKIEIIESLPEDAVLTLYRQGDFEDLCRGPHVLSTGQLKAFKLTHLSAAYWRGDHRNAPLQRIYGTCWPSEKSLREHLQQLEEAQKRDHRRLGQTLDLFRFESFAPGAVFWLPKGWTLFQCLLSDMRTRQAKAGYLEINTPDVMDRQLWEQSGHWENYREHMFTTQTEDQRHFALKPMNCPGAVALFASSLKSYRDLPLRLAEFGKVHRYEPSGALHGLLRVRHFTQDDAHIFCTRSQMRDECIRTIQLVFDTYQDFGFDQVAVKLSTRPDHRIGSDATWDTLEHALASALDTLDIPYQISAGDGAFYGPKLEFVLRDAIGRDWQCGTLQVDLNLPERFDIGFINALSERERPVLLHRALFGSLERFIGILLEHHGGALPAWLAPVQVAVLNIGEQQLEYADRVRQRLQQAGLRCELDGRQQTINRKIREQTLQKTPWLLVVGQREAERQTVTLRSRDGEQLGSFGLEEAVTLLLARCQKTSKP